MLPASLMSRHGKSGYFSRKLSGRRREASDTISSARVKYFTRDRLIRR